MVLPNLKSLTDIANMASGATHQILTVPLSEVVSKEQVRKKFLHIDELAASMKAEGQQSPIIVSPKNSDGKYVIQKGERRWRALNVAGIPTIDIIVRQAPRNRIDEIAGELIENIQRDDLKALEIAEGLGALLEEGLSRKEISERLGKSLSYVSIMLSLRKIPKQIRKLYDDDLVIDPNTLYTLKQIFDEDPAFGEKVCSQARRQGGLSRTKARELLAAVKGANEADGEDDEDEKKESEVTHAPDAPEAKVPDVAPLAQVPAAAAPNDSAVEVVPIASTSEASTHEHSDLQAVSSGQQQVVAEATAAPVADSVVRPTVQVQILVEAALPQGGTVQGSLVLNRVDPDARYGWIKPSGEGEDETVRIEVGQIRILEVRAAH